jgi:superfamily II DNA/RNA helicase
MRSALVDYFREQGRIMIATEAGAEGINLQFCSLVVNYDLPWNPQRIEQRIGRCHRYGQKHDVVVVNFLNRKNEADQRVFELLSEKFQLFEGVFGASDEVLGAIESGVDFEKRIAAIYQNCRKPEEIATAFDQLQLELSLEINESMTRTRQQAAGELRRRSARKAQGARRSLPRLPQPLRTPADAAHAARTGRPGRISGDASFRLVTNPFPQQAATSRWACMNCRAAPAKPTSTASTIRWPKPLSRTRRAATCRLRDSVRLRPA